MPAESGVRKRKWSLFVLGALFAAAAARADIVPNSLRVTRSGTGATLSWGAGSGPYAVYRAPAASSVGSPANQFGRTIALSFESTVPVPPGAIAYYQVGVASGCVADIGCSDGDLCDGVEHCNVAGNTCLPGTPINCDDLNACTVDSCASATGLCAHNAAPRDAPCDDADACTSPDLCDGFGTCTGRAAGSEACNGRDDTCDGQVDEGFGTVTCGAGACQRTVAACVGGAFNVCVPGTPAVEACDSIDNDCDGAVDEDGCNCVHVAPTGIDTNPGTATNPMLTIQAAINRAAAFGPPIVCVATGVTCISATTYSGAVTMANGVSVYGGYQAFGTNWPRSASCVTRIQTGTASGVVFPGSITAATILDTFQIVRTNATTTAGVTVDGAHNVTLSQLVITGGGNASSAYGVNLVSGAQATIRASTIDGGLGTVESIGIRSVGAQPTIIGNCSTLDANGRCTSSPCGITSVAIRGRSVAGTGASYAVLLQDSPGAVVDRNAVCSTGTDQVAGVRVIGDGAGITIARNSIRAQSGANDTMGVSIEDCGGAAPWIVNNSSIAVNGLGATAVGDGIRAMGNCHPVIDGNVTITGPDEGAFGGSGVRCGANGAGIASRCVISGNVIKGSAASFAQGATGVRCEGGACSRILNNSIQGGRAPDVTGLSLDASGPLVDANIITGGCGTASATAVLARDAYARLQNNRISAGATCAAGTTTPLTIALRVIAASGPHSLDVHSNDLDGANILTATSCTSIALALDAGASPPAAGSGTYRNNIMRAGVCVSRYDVSELTASADPRIFENNDLDPSGGPTALYVNEASVGLGTASAVNALADMIVSGVISLDPLFVSYPSDLHLSASSPCIGAGTPIGAPALDMDGNPRGALPDIGADEF